MTLINPYQRARLLLIVGAAASIALFWWAGKTFGIPYYHGIEGSLLYAPSAALSLLVVAVMLAVCTALGTLIAGTVRFDAGLFAASIGLAIFSMRGGATGQILRAAADTLGANQPSASPTVLWVLAAELAILTLFLLGAWGGLWAIKKRGWLASDEFRDGLETPASSIADRAAALALQVLVTGALMVLLCRSDAKAQTLICIAIASFVGTLLAHGTFPVSPSSFFWLGAPIVGILGYIICYFFSQGWRLGEIRSVFGPLARPLPLDYASFGVAGAILGYWTSRRWHRDQADRGEGEGQEAQEKDPSA